MFLGRRTPAKKTQPSMLTEVMIMDAEAAIANLDFFPTADVDMEDDDEMNDDVDVEAPDDMVDEVKALKRIGKLDNLDDDVDAEAMEVLNELNLLSESEERQDIKNEGEWNKGKKCRQNNMSFIKGCLLYSVDHLL